MGKETEALKLFYQKQSKNIGFGGLLLSILSALVYLGVDIGESQEKIKNLESQAIEAKSDIRDIDNEINALGIFNSKEHNDLTNDIILIHERIEVLRKQLDGLEMKIRYEHRRKRKR